MPMQFNPMDGNEIDKYYDELIKDPDSAPQNLFHAGSGSALHTTQPKENTLAYFKKQLAETPQEEWTSDHYLARLYMLLNDKNSLTHTLLTDKNNYSNDGNVFSETEFNLNPSLFPNLIPAMYDSPKKDDLGTRINTAGKNCGTNNFFKMIATVRDETWEKIPETAFVVSRVLSKLNMPIPTPHGAIPTFEEEIENCRGKLGDKAGTPENVALLLRIYAAGDGKPARGTDKFFYPYQNHQQYEASRREELSKMLGYAHPLMQAARVGEYRQDEKLMSFLRTDEALQAAKAGRLRERYQELSREAGEPKIETEKKVPPINPETLHERGEDLTEMLQAFDLPTTGLANIDVAKHKISGSAEYQKMARALLTAMQEREINGGAYDPKNDKMIRDACAEYCLAKPTVRKTQSGRDRFNRALNLMMAVSDKDDPTVTECFRKINEARGYRYPAPEKGFKNLDNYVTPQEYGFRLRHDQRRMERRMELCRRADEASKTEFEKIEYYPETAEIRVGRFEKNFANEIKASDNAATEEEKLTHRLTAVRCMVMAQLIIHRYAKDEMIYDKDLHEHTQKIMEENDLQYSAADLDLKDPEQQNQMMKAASGLSKTYLHKNGLLKRANVARKNTIDALIDDLSEMGMAKTAKNPDGLYAVEHAIHAVREIYGLKPVLHEEYVGKVYSKEEFAVLKPYVRDSWMNYDSDTFAAVGVMAALTKDVGGSVVVGQKGLYKLKPEESDVLISAGNSNSYLTDLGFKGGPRETCGKSFKLVCQPAREKAYEALKTYTQSNPEPLAKLIVEGLKNSLYYNKHAQLPGEQNREVGIVDSSARMVAELLKRDTNLMKAARKQGLTDQDLDFVSVLSETEKLGRANDKALELLTSGAKLSHDQKLACITAVIRHRALAEACRKKEEAVSAKINDDFYADPIKNERMDELSQRGGAEADKEMAYMMQKDMTGKAAHESAVQTEYFQYYEEGGAFADRLAGKFNLNIDALMNLEDNKKLGELLKDLNLYAPNTMIKNAEEREYYEQFRIAPEAKEDAEPEPLQIYRCL